MLCSLLFAAEEGAFSLRFDLQLGSHDGAKGTRVCTIESRIIKWNNVMVKIPMIEKDAVLMQEKEWRKETRNVV